MDGSDLGHESCLVWTVPEIELISNEFMPWASPQPDNARNGEHCIDLINNPKGTWKWNDLPCDQNEYFLCKRSIDSRHSMPALPSVDDIKNSTLCNI